MGYVVQIRGGIQLKYLKMASCPAVTVKMSDLIILKVCTTVPVGVTA